MWKIFLVVVSLLAVLSNVGEAIMCHRCFSSMGGCGNQLDWWMFPWKDCGDSQFCVKVIEKVGSEDRIIRECENVLLESARHRLRMPVLRRHGYCEPSRKNDQFNPLQLTNDKITYCFCNDWNGCNTASGLKMAALPIGLMSVLVTWLLSRWI